MVESDGITQIVPANRRIRASEGQAATVLLHQCSAESGTTYGLQLSLTETFPICHCLTIVLLCINAALVDNARSQGWCL
jgi:hypothetical protein